MFRFASYWKLLFVSLSKTKAATHNLVIRLSKNSDPDVDVQKKKDEMMRAFIWCGEVVYIVLICTQRGGAKKIISEFTQKLPNLSLSCQASLIEASTKSYR